MNKKIKVICKESCQSAGGGRFIKNETYNCEVLGDAHYITDKNNNIIRLEENSPYDLSKFSTYFYTQREARKEKIKKLNLLCE